MNFEENTYNSEAIMTQLTQGAERFLKTYQGPVPKDAIKTMALHVQAQYGSLKCHRLHCVLAVKKLKGTKMIWVVCKHGGKELVIHINKALAEEGLKSGLYLRKATKYDLSTLSEWRKS